MQITANTIGWLGMDLMYAATAPVSLAKSAMATFSRSFLWGYLQYSKESYAIVWFDLKRLISGLSGYAIFWEALKLHRRATQLQ